MEESIAHEGTGSPLSRRSFLQGVVGVTGLGLLGASGMAALSGCAPEQASARGSVVRSRNVRHRPRASTAASPWR